MKVQLVCAPEGAPNSSFGVYDPDGKCLEFTCSDWEWASLATRFGWGPCPCGRTDGTVDCPHRKVSDMLSEAYDYLREHEGEHELEWD